MPVAATTISRGKYDKVLDADGVTLMVQYGDLARTHADFQYDARRRISAYKISRVAPAAWASGATGYLPPAHGSTDQVDLEDVRFGYDVARLTSITNARVPGADGEWPPGAKPASRQMEYDGFDRLSLIKYGTGADSQTPPFAAEITKGDRSPAPSRNIPSRVASLTWLAACGGHDATPTPNVSRGSVAGRSLDIKSASILSTGRPLGSWGEFRLALSDVADPGCNSSRPNSTTLYLDIVNIHGLVIPGTYGKEPGTELLATVQSYDGDCATMIPGAKSTVDGLLMTNGTVTVTSASATSIEGSFNVTFDGGTLEGSFNATPLCQKPSLDAGPAPATCP